MNIRTILKIFVRLLTRKKWDGKIPKKFYIAHTPTSGSYGNINRNTEGIMHGYAEATEDFPAYDYVKWSNGYISKPKDWSEVNAMTLIPMPKGRQSWVILTQ